jgi:hypothetical protein
MERNDCACDYILALLLACLALFLWAVALDQHSNIIWSYQSGYLATHLEQNTPSSLTLVSRQGRETIDLRVNAIRVWQGERQRLIPGRTASVTTVDAHNLHSESVSLPNGNQLLPSTEMRIPSDYPTQPDNPSAPAIVNELSGASLVYSNIHQVQLRNLWWSVM